MRSTGSWTIGVALGLAMAVGGGANSAEPRKPGSSSARYFTAAVMRGAPVALKKKGYPADIAARNMQCMERAAPARITPLFVAFLSGHFSAAELQQLDGFFESAAGRKLERMAEVTFLRKYGETTEPVPEFTADERAVYDAFRQSPAGIKFASPEVQGAARPGTEIDEKVGAVIRECQAG